MNKGHISKETTILAIVFAALAACIGCRNAQVASKVPYADRFFLLKSSSWLWFYRGDIKYIRLGVVCSPALPSEDIITSVSLTGQDARVVPSRWSLGHLGPQGDGYRFYDLDLELDSVPPGTYELDTLVLTCTDGSQGRWDVGKWTLVFDPGEDKGAQYIRIGERTNYIGDLAWYTVELTNISTQDIRVEGLRFSLPGVSTDDVILIDDSNFSNGEASELPGQPPKPPATPAVYPADPSLLLMKPGITRTFQFNYRRSDQVGDVQLFTIKPLLLLEVNGEQVQASLSSATYGPWYLDEKTVREVIGQGGRLTGDAD